MKQHRISYQSLIGGRSEQQDAFGKVAKAKRAQGNAGLGEYLEGLIK